MAKLGKAERRKNTIALILIALALAAIIASINFADFMGSGHGSNGRVGGIAAGRAGG